MNSLCFRIRCLGWIVGLALAWQASSASAAFLVQFDPTQTIAFSNGTTRTVAVDFLIEYINDGDPATLSSYTIDIAAPGSGLTFANPIAGDFAFENGPSLSTGGGVTSIGAFGFVNNTVPGGAASTLFTLDFVVDASVVEQTFPLDISLRDANRDGFTGIEDEFTTVSGTFRVTAVPEPGSWAVLTCLVVGAMVHHRRRRSKTAGIKLLNSSLLNSDRN